MTLAPERLVEQWLRDHRAAADSVIFAPAFPVPYHLLSGIDGWIVWLGHPPVPEGLPLLPVPEELLWNNPETAIATALLVSADYSVRRGADSAATAFQILQREGPVAILTPGKIHRSLEPVLEAARRAGLSVVGDVGQLAQIPSFSARAAAHSIDLGRPHDPGLSFEQLSLDVEIGDSPDSSFVLHDQGAHDGISLYGDLSPHVAIEIGLAGKLDWLPSQLAEWQNLAAECPCFLGEVACRESGTSLVIGWPSSAEPSAEQIAGAFHAWLKAFTQAPVVDVRLHFASGGDHGDELLTLRNTAEAIRRDRQAHIRGEGEYTDSRVSITD